VFNNPINYIDLLGLEECRIEWEEGGTYTVETWTEGIKRGYWKAFAMHKAYLIYLASMKSPVSEQAASKKFAYYIEFTTYALEGTYIRYYYVCYECDKQISKEFLFQTKSWKFPEPVIIKQREKTRYI